MAVSRPRTCVPMMWNESSSGPSRRSTRASRTARSAMTDQSLTAAVLLGASSFPLHSETYAPNEAFLRSKQDFRAYLQDQDNGLALPDDAICDLFDLQHLPSQQLVAIGRFLEKITKSVDRGTICNLI